MLRNGLFLVTNIEMENLVIYKASAGSGKTFTLVKEFLIRALQGHKTTSGDTVWSPYGFAHILCVTFTRKATAEMKERITRTLYQIAVNDKKLDSYIAELCETLELTSSALRTRARQCLEVILHNYSALSVFTIDSFILQVFDSLVWELNLKPEQHETTNMRALLTAASQYLLQHLSTDTEEAKAVYAWCEMHAQNALTQRGSWRTERKLIARGYQMFADDFVLPSVEDRKKLFSLQSFQSMQERLLTTKRSIAEELGDAFRQLTQILESEGVQGTELSQGNTARNGWVAMRTQIEKLDKEGDDPLKLSTTVLNWKDNADKWVKKSQKGREALVQSIENNVRPIYQRVCSQILGYNTTLFALRKLPELGLLNELRAALDNVEREKGVLLLADLAYILHGVAEGNDASFIYERMGTRFQSLFIDEFQDTSRLHWELLKPFVGNAIAEGGMGLLVGDVKQAIYRWRGGDWALLDHEIIEEANGWEKEVRPLETNYRSALEVVTFNNELFQSLCEVIKQNYIGEFVTLAREAEIDNIGDLLESYCQNIDKIYTLNQKYRADAPSGYIELALFPIAKKPSVEAESETDKEEESTEQEVLEDTLEVQYTLELLKRFREAKIPFNQIAILVREGRTAQRYADALTREGIEVISQDAFLLDKSQDVQLMMAALRVAISQENPEYNYESLDVMLLAQYFERLDYPPEEMGAHWTHERRTNYSDNLQQVIKWLRSMGTLPLLNLFDNIAYGLHLPSSPSEMPYFSNLRDRVYAFQKGGESGTFQFINAYDEEDETRRIIEAPANENAVNIMTIHKSKGLEFEVVICPEINFSFFKNNSNEILWASEVGLDDAHLPLLPHGNEKYHFSSFFARNLLEEYYLSTVDTLNLLYVAFTRAKSQLYLIATDVEPKKTTLSNNLADYLLPALKDTFQKLAPDQNRELGQTDLQVAPVIFCYGSPSMQRVESGHQPTSLLQPRAYNKDERFKQVEIHVRQALEEEALSFRELINRSQAANLGTLLHKFMMEVNSVADLERLVEHFTRNGLTAYEESTVLVQMLQTAMCAPPLAACYNAQREVWIEHEFVDKQGRIVRPDRIVFFEDQTVVIDFKFGSPQEHHRKQIERYKALLRALNYPAPQGILWYIDVRAATYQVVEC